MALKRDDLNGLIAPAHPTSEIPHYTIYTDFSQVPKPTPEEKQRALEATDDQQLLLHVERDLPYVRWIGDYQREWRARPAVAR